MSDIIRSRRSSSVVWFSPILDKLFLSPEAIRVYVHLLCCTSQDDIHFSSIDNIGDRCFPHTKPEKTKKIIEKAIAELIDRNIICCERTTSSDGSISRNHYYITGESDWKRTDTTNQGGVK